MTGRWKMEDWKMRRRRRAAVAALALQTQTNWYNL
jgi:hypothetical protein